MSRRPPAFTLVELLVVISIIAVLISLLLPALAEVKRKANLLKDVANLHEHGKGAASYSSAHKGRMPSAPPGNGRSGGRGLYTGPRFLPASRFAVHDGRGGGEGFDQGGAGAPHNGWAFNAGGLAYDDVWRMHHIAFGDWIVDASGAGLLHEVFASPGSVVEANFRAIRAGDTPLVFPDDYPGFTATSDTTAPQSALLLPCSAVERGEGTCFLQPSYRYTYSALFDRAIDDPDRHFFKFGVSLSGVGRGFDDGQAPGSSWARYRAWVQRSDFRFPSQKVVFWDFFAANSRRGEWYFSPGARVAVSTGDGGARLTEPYRVMPAKAEVTRNYVAGAGWGTLAEFDGGMHSTVEPTDQPFGGGDKPFAWFAMTAFGPEGRDLAGQ